MVAAGAKQASVAAELGVSQPTIARAVADVPLRRQRSDSRSRRKAAELEPPPVGAPLEAVTAIEGEATGMRAAAVAAGNVTAFAALAKLGSELAARRAAVEAASRPVDPEADPGYRQARDRLLQRLCEAAAREEELLGRVLEGCCSACAGRVRAHMGIVGAA
jgi:hypothetical protein